MPKSQNMVKIIIEFEVAEPPRKLGSEWTFDHQVASTLAQVTHEVLECGVPEYGTSLLIRRGKTLIGQLRTE